MGTEQNLLVELMSFSASFVDHYVTFTENCLIYDYYQLRNYYYIISLRNVLYQSRVAFVTFSTHNGGVIDDC